MKSLEWDTAKDEANIAKHGVSLALAEAIEWDQGIAMVDDRKDYGETRYIAYAPIEDRVFVVVYTLRGQVTRVISLRKANKREVKRYVQATDQNAE